MWLSLRLCLYIPDAIAGVVVVSGLSVALYSSIYPLYYARRRGGGGSASLSWVFWRVLRGSLGAFGAWFLGELVTVTSKRAIIKVRPGCDC